MSVECSLFAVSAERAEEMRATPTEASDEARLRAALSGLALSQRMKPDATEAELLAEARAAQAFVHDDPAEAAEMKAYLAHEKALVDAALARDDRAPAFELGKSWDVFQDVLIEETGYELGFFFGGESLGEPLSYGPPSLRGHDHVAAFAAFLADWNGERFVSAAEARRRASDGAAGLASMFGGRELTEEQRTQFAKIAEQGRRFEMDGFERFKAYISDAAAAGRAVLIWMS